MSVTLLRAPKPARVDRLHTDGCLARSRDDSPRFVKSPLTRGVQSVRSILNTMSAKGVTACIFGTNGLFVAMHRPGKLRRQPLTAPQLCPIFP